MIVRRPSDRVLALAAPALLIVVALVQQTLVRTRHLTPWKGGGFGMFAGVDNGRTRLLRVVLQTDSGDVAVDAADLAVMQASAERLLAMPSEGMLARAAREASGRRWALASAPGATRVARPATRADSALVVRGVRLTVLRTSYDAATRSLDLAPMLVRDYPAAGAP